MSDTQGGSQADTSTLESRAQGRRGGWNENWRVISARGVLKALRLNESTQGENLETSSRRGRPPGLATGRDVGLLVVSPLWNSIQQNEKE